MRQHLGSRVSTLVDGQLGPGAAERALAHVASCPTCRDALDAERAARRALRAGEDLRPSDELTGRLLALRGGSAARSPDGTFPEGTLTPSAGRRARMRHPARWLLVGGGTAAAAAVGLTVLGAAASPVLDPEELRTSAGLGAPPVERTDDGAADLTTPTLAWLRAEGWVAPDVVTSGLAVVGVAADGDEVSVELAGGGEHVVVSERHGRLRARMDASEHVLVGGTDAVLLGTAPWTAAVQAGDVVVVVTDEGDLGAGLAVLAALPATAPVADGALPRLARGWDVLRSSVRHAVVGTDVPSRGRAEPPAGP